MVIQLRKYIEKLLAGGGGKGNSKQEEHGDNASAAGRGLPDTAEHTWAMDRLLNTKCVEDEVLILRDTITRARLHEEEEGMGTEVERPKVQKRKALDGEDVEREVQPESAPVVKRKKVVKFDDSPMEDTEAIGEGPERGGGLPQKKAAAQRQRKSKGAESESDVEVMDKEMAGVAIANLARRLQKRQKKVPSSEEGEEEEEEEGEEMEQGEDSETDSGVISASDVDEGESSEEEDEDISDEGSGRSQMAHSSLSMVLCCGLLCRRSHLFTGNARYVINHGKLLTLVSLVPSEEPTGCWAGL
ncbi:hypothetical protein CBR_g19265 [Chara braunii]|uniref:Uncharacterized protein n=1 Tax=Chara braunii TaxID=69332 RepID=A0A388KXP7_CHABU|nr:hypothetical protein CBR_g19265 [Chara braunii]|eukprot:GBG74752.1 hypothetical protein CBR_g19265 [Chara braunii]